jgi:hypothetical protein
MAYNAQNHRVTVNNRVEKISPAFHSIDVHACTLTLALIVYHYGK